MRYLKRHGLQIRKDRLVNMKLTGKTASKKLLVLYLTSFCKLRAEQ